MIVAEASYELSDPTVDSQIITLKNSGADVLVQFVFNKAAAQAIRKVHDLGWRPTRYLSSTSTSSAAVLKPAGIDKAVGIYSLGWYKDPVAKQWESDPWLKEHQAFMKKYLPEDDATQSTYVPGVLIAQTMVQVLKACGDELTRENVLKQATSIKDLQMPGLLPGVKLNNSRENYAMLHALQMVQFDGTQWARQGELMSIK
jgi:ABC-type branched-subunit amino acid transport system substrate-binding protein